MLPGTAVCCGSGASGRPVVDSLTPELPLANAAAGAVAYFRPNQSVAMVRKEKNPTTSVTVVTNGLDATAGSNLQPVERRAE